jgi:hypothetical protein
MTAGSGSANHQSQTHQNNNSLELTNQIMGAGTVQITGNAVAQATKKRKSTNI